MIEEEKDKNWWKHGIVYHIYPRSFMDSNNDGRGDLQGIIQKLNYLEELGIHAIWLSPVYQSPLIDGGYDISDYKSIHPNYGTMDDFKQLLNEAHRRNIRIIMDLVLNHTSDMHPWFLESKSSKENDKRDWYIWLPPRNGKPPNNWRTNFGKKAWRYDPLTQEYYYHSFFWEQPDLNWRNPEVKKAMFDIISFWLDMGVDGFRLDVINMIFKNSLFKNDSIKSLFSNKEVFSRNQPEVYEVLKEFRLLLEQYPNKTSVGEIYTPPPGNAKLVTSFLGNGSDMLHLVFDFSLIFSFWNASSYYKIINKYYQHIPTKGWPCFFLSNHDIGRSVGRTMFSFHKQPKAKLHATLLLTLKGTPFIYYGDEIGMENTDIPKHKIKDLYGKIFYPLYKGRDGARTPMQWDDSLNGGFTTGKPWLPLHKNYRQVNVKNQAKTDDSVLNVYKHLIELRNKMPVLQQGEIQFIKLKQKGVLCYERTHENKKVLVVLNFTSRKKTVSYELSKQVEVLFSTHSIQHFNENTIFLNPFESIVLGIKMRKIDINCC
jgi:alpha-glucosidase